jgi:hypothetical protein
LRHMTDDPMDCPELKIDHLLAFGGDIEELSSKYWRREDIAPALGALVQTGILIGVIHDLVLIDGSLVRYEVQENSGSWQTIIPVGTSIPARSIVGLTFDDSFSTFQLRAVGLDDRIQAERSIQIPKEIGLVNVTVDLAADQWPCIALQDPSGNYAVEESFFQKTSGCGQISENIEQSVRVGNEQIIQNIFPDENWAPRKRQQILSDTELKTIFQDGFGEKEISEESYAISKQTGVHNREGKRRKRPCDLSGSHLTSNEIDALMIGLEEGSMAANDE